MKKEKIISAAILIAVTAAMIIIVPGAQRKQKEKELEDMRIINMSIELPDEQYLALKRRAARIGRTQEDWTFDDEVRYTAAAALALQAEEELKQERQALRNAQITDDFITDDTPISVVPAQKEVEEQTLSDDPEGEPAAETDNKADSSHTGETPTGQASPKTDITADDGGVRDISPEIDLFLRCVQAEAGNQSLECKTATAEAIMNRVADPRFPDTITGVIIQKGQFSVVASGKIEQSIPDADTCKAVFAALDGSRTIPADYVYFNNQPIGSDVIQIGGHYFGR